MGSPVGVVDYIQGGKQEAYKKGVPENARFVRQNAAKLVRMYPPVSQRAGDPVILMIPNMFALPLFLAFLASLLAGSLSLSLLMLFLTFIVTGVGSAKGAERTRSTLS